MTTGKLYFVTCEGKNVGKLVIGKKAYSYVKGNNRQITLYVNV